MKLNLASQNSSSSGNTSSQDQTTVSADLTKSNLMSNSQIQFLVADNDHDVAVLDECDLAVRYDKIEMLVYFVAGKYYLKRRILPKYTLIIQCSDKSLEDDPFKIIGSGPLNNSTRAKKEFLQGLGIPQAQNLIHSYFPDNDNSTYTFQFNKKYYRFFQVSTNDNYRLQFNSLAPSTPSIKL